MIRHAPLYLLRLTFKSGEHVDQWCSEYTIDRDRSGLSGIQMQPPAALPRILGFRMDEVACVQLIAIRNFRFRWS